MKFLRSLVLVTLIFCFACYCYSEGLDYSGMTDADLIKIQGILESEMNSRGIDKNNLLMTGIYVVGIDIKSGEYIFTNVSDRDFFVYSVYKDMAQYDKVIELEKEIEDFIAPSIVVFNNEFSRVDLEENNILCVIRGMAKVESQKPDWKP